MNEELVFSHLDEQGQVRMVEVGEKPETVRRAVAEARVRLSPEVRRSLLEGSLPKGDALAAVRLAGIMAAKRTSDLIPLCHPLPLSGIEMAVAPSPEGVSITAAVRTNARTGVEMEAMVGVCVASLTLYDMVKGLDRGAVIGPIRLLEKTGGKSGDWRRQKPGER
ncbi:MAG: cyclic pyranopterin monophosphate synthase MoaC [Acidimicrobiia bacterium]|nr:cyclic pyranopterin monophosphate synthase MoaC [Acidimicrobiia bacterium]MXY75424.1 cyclic pyranopterin monophosphate synthase MoaC [Acidimicrobiia bacterium]MYB79307.1 cyclic pyranopterin monophosphate synthase MoaC [Acidimicrobiia bacterium]MYG91677.1 cyclic pyranopterin monophosphate synthase MoaC [Acidimicrobiia bacterium]